MARSRVVQLPDEISEETAAAMMVKGGTVEYLVRRTYAVQPGDNVLLTAAAGGVGLIACQWLHALGANVIGTVGTPEKGELAKRNGCDHVILYREENIAEGVAEITDGEGCRVAYDSVGASTLGVTVDQSRSASTVARRSRSREEKNWKTSTGPTAQE